MTRIALLSNRAVLSVSGEDRVSFLQGLVSNDVAAATPDTAVWAAMLTPQGKWLADFFIVAEPEQLLLDLEADQAGMLVQRLTRYRLRARVTVESTSGAIHAGWSGPAPAGAYADPRLADAGWRTRHPVQANAAAAEWDLHRLRLGLPDGSRDMEPEKTTLLEAGFDELHGLSWTKGCYMGQELTARIKYRGLLKRRFVPVAIEGAVPPPGTAIVSDGAEVGMMRSGRDTLGLALLRVDAIDRPSLQCGTTTLIPTRPPWLQSKPPILVDAAG